MRCLILLALVTSRLFYPDHFSTTLTKEMLEEIKNENYVTHTTFFSELLHNYNEKCTLLPCRLFLHAAAYCVEPFPGEHKDSYLWQHHLKRSVSGIVAAATFFPALSSFLVSLPIRWLEVQKRPFLSYLYTKDADVKKQIALSKEKPLHIATFNVGLTPSSLNIPMDLRTPLERACEIAHCFIQDERRPEILVLEEGWHEGAVKELCTRLKHIYPHILHNVAPSFSGLSSGIVVFSLFPIKEATFLRFDNMVSYDATPPRGVLKLKIMTEKGPLYLYSGIHMQAYDTRVCVEARERQLQQLHDFVSGEPNAMQVVMGDFNISALDCNGHNNFLNGQAKLLQSFHQMFDDLFLYDHDLMTGERNHGFPYFLEGDNQRMGTNFEEPCASWYDGPFIQDPFWGTPKWYSTQRARLARFDYIAFPKNSLLSGRAEIRRIVMEKGKESPSSDHLPVHALIWIEKE